MMPHTKYNGVVSDNIFLFAVYKTKGHNLNKLGNVALGDATTL